MRVTHILAFGLMLFAPPLARAGTAGLSVGLSADGLDAVPLPEGGVKTRFSPGFAVAIPYRFSLSPEVHGRITVRGDFAGGTDRITWAEAINGEAVRFWDSEHGAWFGALSAMGGVEPLLPAVGPATPYFGATLGLIAAGAFHDLLGPTAKLMDPASNSLDSAYNLDPYTVQVRPISEIYAGASVATGRRHSVFAELGYSAAFFPAVSLRGALPAYDARREAFAWDALRCEIGLNMAL